MYTVLFVSLIALLLTYLEQKNTLKYGMFLGFSLLFLIAAIRYNYGNDYVGYYDIYRDIVSYPLSINDILNRGYRYEPGWILLNYLSKPIGGFFALSAFVALIENLVYYRFIKKYVPIDYWVLAVFIYVFSSNFYLLNMSMLRQGLAISLFVWSFDYIKDHRLIIALLVSFLAWSIHRSAIVLFPFVLLPYVMKKQALAPVFAVIIGALFILFILANNVTEGVYNSVLQYVDMQDYSDYYGEDQQSVNYGIGFIINLIPFLLLLYYLLKGKVSAVWQRILVVLASVSTLIIPFGEIVPMIGRIGMYFSAFSIAAMPIVFKWIPRRNLAYITLFLYVFMTLYGYWNFFHSDVWTRSYKEYHTIFEIL